MWSVELTLMMIFTAVGSSLVGLFLAVKIVRILSVFLRAVGYATFELPPVSLKHR